jgi:hypothetical protein
LRPVLWVLDGSGVRLICLWKGVSRFMFRFFLDKLELEGL